MSAGDWLVSGLSWFTMSRVQFAIYIVNCRVYSLHTSALPQADLRCSGISQFPSCPAGWSLQALSATLCPRHCTTLLCTNMFCTLLRCITLNSTALYCTQAQCSVWLSFPFLLIQLQKSFIAYEGQYYLCASSKIYFFFFQTAPNSRTLTTR